KANPPMQRAVIAPPPVENCPDERRRRCNDNEQEVLDVSESGVAAAGREVGCDLAPHAKNMDGNPRHDGLPEFRVRLEYKLAAGEGREYADAAGVGHGIQQPIARRESERDAMR